MAVDGGPVEPGMEESERWRVLEEDADAVVILAADWRVVFANRAGRRLLPEDHATRPAYGTFQVIRAFQRSLHRASGGPPEVLLFENVALGAGDSRVGLAVFSLDRERAGVTAIVVKRRTGPIDEGAFRKGLARKAETVRELARDPLDAREVG